MGFIPVNEPLLNENEKKYLFQCIDTGWISSEGPFVKEFEQKMCATVGRKYGVAVSNGTAVLEVAVQALGIMIVHLYGLPVAVDIVLALAKKYDLKVIEDAAEMHAQTYKGRSCGSFGDISTFSFYPNKHITTGEGSMVLTDDEELAKMGYQCTGIDMSPLMIDIAQKNVKKSGKNIDFSVADIRNFESQIQYDAVISLFHVMSYQTKNQDIISAFRSAGKALGKGGVLVFDAWYGPGVLSNKPCVRVKEIENEKNKLVRIARPVMHDKENVVDVCYEVFVIDKESGHTKVINEIHSMRYFFRPELDFLLREQYRMENML